MFCVVGFVGLHAHGFSDFLFLAFGVALFFLFYFVFGVVVALLAELAVGFFSFGQFDFFL